MLLGAGVRLANFIPPQAQRRVNEEMRKQGIDVDVAQIKPENLDELIDQLRDLTIEIDHTSPDPEHKHDDVKVKICAE